MDSQIQVIFLDVVLSMEWLLFGIKAANVAIGIFISAVCFGYILDSITVCLT
ncbi:hypothetical protein BD408DRAFT_422773 [Parasitella parasitica]|nr:hypothetical protein BD408DRAFT_422773 [Parasitella parasitica]